MLLVKNGMTAEYRKATGSDLEALWNRSISENPGDPRYLRWKEQFIRDNRSGDAATFAVIIDGEPVGEGTLLFSPVLPAIRGRTQLADGATTANLNALRIRKEFEGQGHISRLMRAAERYAKSLGYSRVTIGVEAQETRNLAIYLHWGYTEFVHSEMEDATLVLYYAKTL